MAHTLLRAALLLGSLLTAMPAHAQFTVLDRAQDGGQGSDQTTVSPPPAEPTPDAPPPACGTQPLTIASMGWPSAEVLAAIHQRILTSEYGCEVRLTPGDMAATASSMNATGQPAAAPELWVTRIPEVWNAGIAAQAVRPAAPTFVETRFEGWFMPDYVLRAHPELASAAQLAAGLPSLGAGRVKFISCPADWACALINRNLVTALGLEALVELIEPANRFEMDTLIAEAVSRSEPILFYYWQPNAVLSQFNFASVDMGAFDDEAAKCLARLNCAAPVPSAFVEETVVVAVSEWVFTDLPVIASYWQRTSLPLPEMNTLLAQLNEPGATVDGVADRFVAERQDLWRSWAPAAIR